jgi:hypothetical protein
VSSRQLGNFKTVTKPSIIQYKMLPHMPYSFLLIRKKNELKKPSTVLRLTVKTLAGLDLFPRNDMSCVTLILYFITFKQTLHHPEEGVWMHLLPDMA